LTIQSFKLLWIIPTKSLYHIW